MIPTPTNTTQPKKKGKLWTGIGLILIGGIVNFVPYAKPTWAFKYPGDIIFTVIQIGLFIVGLGAIVPVISYSGSNYSGEVESIKFGRFEIKVRPKEIEVKNDTDS